MQVNDLSQQLAEAAASHAAATTEKAHDLHELAENDAKAAELLVGLARGAQSHPDVLLILSAPAAACSLECTSHGGSLGFEVAEALDSHPA